MSVKEYKIPIQVEIIEKSIMDTKPTQSSPETSAKKQSDSGGSNLKDSIGLVVATQIGKQAAQYGISKYGDLTGDIKGQTLISESIAMLSLGAMLLSGPVGIAAAGMTVAINVADYAISVAKENRRVEILKARVGGGR